MADTIGQGTGGPKPLPTAPHDPTELHQAMSDLAAQLARPSETKPRHPLSAFLHRKHDAISATLQQRLDSDCKVEPQDDLGTVRDKVQKAKALVSLQNTTNAVFNTLEKKVDSYLER